jgi:predicted acylesterase/phospholipase RssA
MRLGFCLGPGGLLSLYHLGVLSALQRWGYVTEQTPLAGLSAGAIAVASHGTGVDPMEALNGCIHILEHCLNRTKCYLWMHIGL